MLEKKNLVAILLVVAILLIVWLVISKPKEEVNTPAPVQQAVTTQQSSPKIEVLQQGAGDKAVKAGDTVAVNYVGTLEDGTVFDSNTSTDKPFETEIGVGNVIKGWDLGIVGMKVGEKRKLTISPELGYGNQAVGTIPAGSTLIFDVQLLAIK
jgi:FKBP-type peptidyl-prolyl cis-trans isomerase